MKLAMCLRALLLGLALVASMPCLAQAGDMVNVQRRALAEAEQRFGASSVETVAALQALERALASLSSTQDQLPERIALLARVAAIQEERGPAASSDLATTLLSLGRLRAARPARDFAAAIALYERSLALRRAASGDDHPDVAEVQINLGRARRELKSFDAAIESFRRALAIYAAANGAMHITSRAARSELQQTYMEGGRARDGLAVALEELRLAEASGRRDGPLILALRSVARAYDALGEFASAVPAYEQSLEIERARHPPQSPQIAYSINELARAYNRAGRWAEAVPLLEQSLAIRERIGSPDPWFLGTELRDLAFAYFNMGRYGESIAAERRAIELLERSTPSTATTALSLGFALQSLARTYGFIQRPADALPLQERAVAVHERARGADDANTLRAVLELSQTLATLGRHDAARARYERARAAIVSGPLAEDAVSLANLASAAEAIGASAEAVRWQERVVVLRTHELGEGHPRAAGELAFLAQMKWRAGERAEALRLRERATALRERALGPTHPEMATDYLMLGQLRQEEGQHDRALDAFRRSLAAATPAGSPLGIAGASGRLRDSHARRGEREAAIFWGKNAVNALQQIRSGLASVEPDVLRTYTERARSAYTRLADLLIELGRLAEAEQVLALLKDQELFELVRRSGPTRPQADLVGRERAVATQYEALVAEAVARARELDDLSRRARVGSLNEQDAARRASLQTESQVWRSRFQAWLSALPSSFAGGRDAQTERDRSAQQSTRLQTLVRNDPGAVGLHYVVTEERLSIIIATARGSFGKSVSVDRATLNRQIAALRQALQEPERDPRPAAQALYATLFAPIAAELEAARASTLVLSLTDTLRYIPFAALFDGKQYLVERYAFGQVILGADQRAEASREPWRVAGLGTTQAIAPFKALPGVRAELEAIVHGEGSRGVLPGTIALDHAFGRQHLESVLTGRFPVVHIGSHFVFRPGDESSSFLLLGDGTRLSLGQMATLDFNGIDLLTLSACDTASGGGENEQGAEVEGLATALARQGAGSVLASLWAVADASTTELMRGFYTRQATQQRASRAQALREAQLALLRGEVPASASTPSGTTVASRPASAESPTQDAQRGASRAGSASAPAFTVDTSRPYAHPYYWAPFVLMGNWL